MNNSFLLVWEIKDLSCYIEKYAEGGTKALYCKLCGKVSNDRSNLRKHVENIHFPDSFLHFCKYCQESFKTKNMLYMHVSSLHKK